MNLSSLQKYVLLQGLGGKNNLVSKSVLINFYKNKNRQPKRQDQITIITRSVERLVNSGLVKAIGVKTKDKWFIKDVILTSLGVKRAKELLGKQQKLPFKNNKKQYVTNNRKQQH